MTTADPATTVRAQPRRLPPRVLHALRVAIAIVLPLVVSAAAGDIRHGGIAALGALAVIYVHELPHRRRAVRLAGVSAGLVLAVAVGSLGSAGGGAAVIAVAVVAAVAAAWSRLRAVPPPGAFMFVLVCATATHIPPAAVPLVPRLALVAAGAAGAWAVAMIGALPVPRTVRLGDTPRPAPASPDPDRVALALRAAARIGAGTAGAALVALALGLPRPDWAAAACAAVLVHDRTRATVRRAWHRTLGTTGGIAVAGLILATGPGVAATIALVAALQFVVELIVARSYAVAAVFIAPLALLLSGLATGPAAGALPALLAARLIETVVGCAMAIAVQLMLPHPAERPALLAPIRIRSSRAPTGASASPC